MKTLPRLIAALLTPVALTGFAPASQAEDLVQVYQLALDSDPVLAAQQSALEASNYNRRQSYAAYRPNINFGINYTDTNQSSTASATSFLRANENTTTTYSLTLRQALYRKDLLSGIDQARASERKANAELQSAYQALIVRVSEAYFNVLAARDNLEFAQAEKSAIERQLQQSKQRFEVGLIAITDVHEAQAAFDLAIASEITAQNQVAVSQQALRQLTGQLPTSLQPLGANITLAEPNPAVEEQWLESALAQNRDIIAAQAAMEAASEAVNKSRAGHQPTLDFVASQNHSEYDGSYGDSTSDTTTLGLVFNLPLYQGGGTSAAVGASRAQLNQARYSLEQQRRAVQRETSDAYLGVQASISRVRALQQAVTSSESALKATEAGYEVGTRTTVDVLNSRRELYRAQRDYARARYDYILASLRLQRAAGMLDAEDLTQINGWLVAK